MIKIIFLLKRRPGMTPAQFREHYENSHVKLADKYIGHLLVDYRRNYPISAVKNPSNVPPGTVPPAYQTDYDAITEMWVKDQAALEEVGRIFNDPKINPILVEDELKFLDRPEAIMIVSEEVTSQA